MKKLIIAIFLMFIVIYPPHFSKADETAKESVLNYLSIKNEILKYQLNKKLDGFYQLYDSLKTKK